MGLIWKIEVLVEKRSEKIHIAVPDISLRKTPAQKVKITNPEKIG